jgi:hypothetical protein
MVKKITLTKRDLTKIKHVRNRELEVIEFKLEKVKEAVLKAFHATGEGKEADADYIAAKVFNELVGVKTASKDKNFVPTVELIQDLVESELIRDKYPATAKAFILYRNKRAELRKEVGPVPEKVKALALESKKYFRNALAELVYYRSYARWIDAEGRRETWIETIDRYMDFMRENIGSKLKESEYKEIREAILNQESMPSMRLIQFAGLPARKTNVCAYNCSFIAPSNFQDFGEIVYISMCGTGVGYTVESKKHSSTSSDKTSIRKETRYVCSTRQQRRMGRCTRIWNENLV